MEAEANVDEESYKSKKWDNESNCLPMSSIFTIWFLSIHFDVADQEEPEYRWAEVLNCEAPVEGKGWFPHFHNTFLSSGQL